MSHAQYGYGLWGLALIWLLARSWPVLYYAQQSATVAATGPYARIRHPQYVAFVLVLFGFLLQWPTLLTLAMFPVLLFAYGRLARARFGESYRQYMEHTPAFIPHWLVHQGDTPAKV